MKKLLVFAILLPHNLFCTFKDDKLIQYSVSPH